MALGTDAIRSEYPLPAYNYRVTVLNGDTAEVIGFSEVSGLSVEHEPVIYRHGLSFLSGYSVIGGMRQPLRLTLRKGLTKNGDFLQQWLAQSYAEPYAAAAKRDITIDLCDEAGSAVIRWTVKGALPVKLEAPSFKADSREVAISAMELMAADLAVDYHPT